MTSTPVPAAGRGFRRRAAVVVLPLVVLLAGAGTSVAIAVETRSGGLERADRLAQAVADEEAGALGDAVRDYSSALDALGAGIANQPAIDDAQFQALSAMADTLPGLSSLSYTVPVDDTAQAVAAAQERLRAQFGTPVTLKPAQTELGEHRFIAAYHGVGTRETLRGADAAALPTVVAAATAARSSGKLAVSAPYVLLADRGLPVAEQQQSVVFTAPVVGGRDQADAGEFRGWVSGAFRAGTVLEASTDRDTSRSAHVQLWDATDPAQPVLLGSLDPEGTDSDRPARTASVIAGNRRWTLSVVPTAQAVTDEVGDGPLVALVVGGGLSLLLAALLFSVTAGRERAQRKVEQATADLAQEVALRSRSEEALRTRESELGAYTTVVADRLRLPLSRLSALSDAARETGAWTAADWHERLDGVDRRLDRARRLVDDLLLYAQVSEMALTERAVDLFATGTLVADEQEALSAHLPVELQPRIEVGPLPEVVGEPWLLHQVLARLVDNAVVHAPPGQPAVVSLGAELTGSRFRGEVWRIEVRDRGLGVPADRRATVFEPFAGEPADVELGGNHLSLALCRRIVMRLGGDVGLEDDPRGGSVFWFTLPVRSTTGLGAAAITSAPLVPVLG
ncbi:sensor histidine kinase [Kineococcus rhizosphaerae]|uniref:Sensor-like histidine kinase SenX3 n=1 Tax=Kineococcus rhizosphaerae TaxID=559628 RepID=A0A2T0R186_9ACTN|nr:ATP-binding protein [Kineococcus rhizosphaerae]PRY13339.1 signal transduction histidine kinase [Kineococcus rhizosphaerae]